MKPALLFLAAFLSATAGADPARLFGEIDGLVAVDGPRPQGKRGDWIQLFVCRGEKVKAGQRLAIQRNTFGRVVQEYVAGASGRVTVAGRVGLGSVETIVEIGTTPVGDVCQGAVCP